MINGIKECTRCDKSLKHIYCIYKLNYYCVDCYVDEIDERKQAIAKLPDISPILPPLGWLHKFQEEDLDSYYINMGEYSLWES